MKEIMKKTITTLDVAEMMEVHHSDILRKLDGRKDRKGYIEILAESQMAVSDYFITSTYQDASGKENKCYEVTKIGCDFLANKFNGEKGILFTARYVKKFDEMEKQSGQSITYQYPVNPSALDSATNAGRLLERVMKSQGVSPHQIAEVIRSVFQQAGIELPDFVVKVPAYEQMSLDIFAQSI